MSRLQLLFRGMLRHHAINRCSLLSQTATDFLTSAQQVSLCRGPHSSPQDAWRGSLESYGNQDAKSALMHTICRLVTV